MAMNTRLIDNIKPVWAMEPKNYTGAAGTASYVSLKNYNHITIAIQTGAWAGGTAAVTLSQAKTVAGGSSKALAFSTMWVNTGAAPDTFTATTVSSNTFNLDTANLLYVIEVDAATLDIDNDFDCISVAIASPGGNNDFYGVTYWLCGSRYPQSALPTSKTD